MMTGRCESIGVACRRLVVKLVCAPEQLTDLRKAAKLLQRPVWRVFKVSENVNHGLGPRARIFSISSIMGSGFVYLVGSGTHKWFKIGTTRNSPKRLRSLQQ